MKRVLPFALMLMFFWSPAVFGMIANSPASHHPHVRDALLYSGAIVVAGLFMGAGIFLGHRRITPSRQENSDVRQIL